MNIMKIMITLGSLIAGGSQVQAVVVVQNPVVPIRPISPFCTNQAEVCRKTCIGPFCATECSDYINECMTSPTIIWQDYHRRWHYHPHHGHHHKKHFHKPRGHAYGHYKGKGHGHHHKGKGHGHHRH